MDRKEKQNKFSDFCAKHTHDASLLTDEAINRLYQEYILNQRCEGGITGSQDAKADAGKLPMNLVPTQINRDIAQVRKYGNEKYGDPNNWRKVDKIRYVAALERHLLAYKDYLNGDDDGLDKESGIEHYKHMACNMAFICEMERWEKKE